MATAATIAARLTLNTDDYDKGIKSAEKKAGNLSSNLMTLGKTMVGIGGAATAAFTVPIVAGFGKAVFAASDLGESISAVETVFGDAADTLLDFGETSATAVGMSQEKFNSLGIVTGSLLQNLGYDSEGAADATVMLAERASDMAAVFNTDVDQALEAINSGLKGEMNPLEQFGVKLNAAGVNAKAMEMGLAATESELTDNAKAQAALAIIMEQTERISGTFTEEAGSLGGSMRILKAQLGDAAAQLGQQLLPYVTMAVQFFSQLVEKFQNLSPAAQKIIVIVGLIVAVIGPLLVIVGTLIMAIGAIIPVISAVVGAVGGALIPIILAIIAYVGALIAIGAVMYLAWKNNWGGIRDTVIEIWETYLKPALQNIWQWLQVYIPIAIQMLSEYWTNVLLPAIETVATWIIGVLVPIFIEVYDYLFVTLPAAIQVLSDYWKNNLKPALETVWAFIQNYIIPTFSTVVTFLNGAFTTALSAISSVWENVLQPALEFVWSFIQDNVMPIVVALVDFFNAAFTLALTALAGLWQNVLAPALEKVWDWVGNKIMPIFVELKNFWDNKFGPIIEKVAGWLGDKLEPAFQGISDVVGSIVGFIQNMTDALKNIKLPAWLTPGSPTPFEIGLLGISEALEQINKKSLLGFGKNLSGLDSPLSAKVTQPSMRGISDLANGGQGGRVYNFNANYEYESPLDLMDEVRLREASGV